MLTGGIVNQDIDMHNVQLGLLAGVMISFMSFIYKDLPLVNAIPYGISLIHAQNPLSKFSFSNYIKFIAMIGCLSKIFLSGYQQR